MIQQILGAVFAVAIALAAAVAYFWGTNWLLDKFLGSRSAMTGDAITRRDTLRSSIRPWLFLFPALLFLAVYLVYPVFETFRLSASSTSSARTSSASTTTSGPSATAISGSRSSTTSCG